MENKYYKIYSKLRENSIGNDKKCSMKSNKTVTVTVSALLSLFIAFSVVCKVNQSKKNIVEKNMYNQNINFEKRDYIYTFNQRIVDNILYDKVRDLRIKIVLNGDNVDLSGELNNPISVYQNIGFLENDLISFYYLTNFDEVDTEKIVRVLGYESWDDYLVQNNYVDKNGKSNLAVWRNDEYQRLYDEYQRSFDESKGLIK